ncbi:hypothetical protein HJ526_16655 [Donghicola sp. C2-DW-16]|uniref:Uncharacterized protein n=1 Tax=Donghicola mangrovi TaxID=2729614 RepID=A0ABX2PJ98_9RHOB|nr:hypothetical protein [Donghicola mangrovi]NVO29062.1 hypothetical protein [Donghicola mangrovi]
MPKLVRLYITQVFVGFGLSAAFVSALLYLNVANLWHLVTHSSGGALAVLMLWVFNGIVFAGVQFGISIMRLGQDDDTPRGPRQHALVREYAPIPVRTDEVRANRRHL